MYIKSKNSELVGWLALQILAGKKRIVSDLRIGI